jgi:hypothetical protein
MAQQLDDTAIRQPRASHRFAARPSRWAIVDADGATVVDDLPSRRDAARRLGSYVTPDHPLPLRVVDPTGQPSGDMIG